MSANDSRTRVMHRALRVRNRCLAVLASHRGLPIPGESDVGAELGLTQALSLWEKRHTPPVAADAAPRTPVTPRWRSPRVERWMLLGLVAVFGFVVGDQLLPRAEAQEVAVEHWLPVTDSVVAELNGRLLRLGQTEVSLPVTIDAAEAAVLVLGSRSAFDSLAARIDSALWIRGTLRDGSPFELHGRMRVVERGFVEMRVAADSTRRRFEVPTFIKALWLAEGHAHLLTR